MADFILLSLNYILRAMMVDLSMASRKSAHQLHLPNIDLSLIYCIWATT